LLIFGVLWFVVPFRLHPMDGDPLEDSQPTGPPK